jgi:hypothetical protein
VVNGLSVFGGVWNDVSINDSTGGNGNSWYETTYMAGTYVNILENFDFGIWYEGHVSPSNTFRTSNEIVYSLSANDSSLWKGSLFARLPGFDGLKPFVEVGEELSHRAGSRGEWVEAGIRPSFDLPVKNLSVVFPIVVGTGFDNYYGIRSNANLQYVQCGPVFIYNISRNVDLVAGVQGLFLEHQAKESDQSRFELIGNVGLRFKF